MADGEVSLKPSMNGIQKSLNRMIDRAKLARGWLNRVGYPMVLEAQRMRWASEGASEGASWRPLSPKYAEYKLRRWANSPGGGRKMLIASGRLVDSVTGDNPKEHYKLVTDNRLEVGTRVPYASDVNEVRNFTKMGRETTNRIKSALRMYLMSK